jgi:hypothetical protein
VKALADENTTIAHADHTSPLDVYTLKSVVMRLIRVVYYLSLYPPY